MRTILRGALTGAAAYVLGYAVAYVGGSGRVRAELGGLNVFFSFVGEEPIPLWQAVGWLYHNALLVPLTYRGTTQNTLADATPLVHLLPAVPLAVAGVLVAYSARTTTPQTGARAALPVTLGFAAFSILGVYAFTATRGNLTFRPDLVLSAVAGVLYPLVFATAGGALAGWLRGRAPPESPTN